MISIGVDGNLMREPITGMGTVALEMLCRLNIDNSMKIIVFVPGSLEERTEVKLRDANVEIASTGKLNYFAWEQIMLPKLAHKFNVDLLWCPYNTSPLFCKKPIVVTIHDLIFQHLRISDAPTLYKKAGIIYRRVITKHSIKKSKRIITITHYSESQIQEFSPNVSDKIDVIYNGTPDSDSIRLQREDLNGFVDQNKITPGFILGFGSIESRKNSIRVLEAYEELPKSLKDEHQLILFGYRGAKNSRLMSRVRDSRDSKNVIILGYISNDEKSWLYENARVFMFPSIEEGFGLPILEAFQKGVPVVTSNVSALPEVAGHAALLVDPTSVNQISSATQRLLTDSSLVRKCVQEGYRQVKKFDWNRSVGQVKTVFRRVASAR